MNNYNIDLHEKKNSPSPAPAPAPAPAPTPGPTLGTTPAPDSAPGLLPPAGPYPSDRQAAKPIIETKLKCYKLEKSSTLGAFAIFFFSFAA